jgi:hypothetical protein
MTATEDVTDEPASPGIPNHISRLYPHIPTDAWVRLSEHRYRANHPSAPNSAVLVVDVFGETLGQGVSYGLINLKPSQRDRAVYADLLERAARLAVHRMACAKGTPLIRPNDDADGVRGCCWWCAALPDQHVPATVVQHETGVQ